MNFSGTLEKARDAKYYLSNAVNKYMSHNQLVQRIDNYQSKLLKEILLLFNQSKKIAQLNKTLSLHQRFLLLLKCNNVPRLDGLLTVAIKAKRSISYIISKVTDAIDGIYNANPSDDDKDLAFLIMQFWGPWPSGYCASCN